MEHSGCQVSPERLIALAMRAGARAKEGWYATRNTMRRQPECPRAILTLALRAYPGDGSSSLGLAVACTRAFQVGWNESRSTYTEKRSRFL